LQSKSERKKFLMLSDSSPSFAIVGSGPSGCYTAQFLRKAFPESRISIFDRLQTPFGLLKYGVAPDHIGTKAITLQFERLFERDAVSFVGGTEIGVDISLDELREEFEVVVLATGLSQDRPLTVPGGSLAGIYGSGRITRLFNGHPEESLKGVSVGERLVIIGHGNVAIDLIRLSLLGAEQLTDFGVDQGVANALSGPQIREIHVVGRSPVGAAKFDIAMINELAKIPDVKFLSDTAEVTDERSDASLRFEAICKLVRESNPDANRQVIFHFGWTPSLLGGDSKVQFIEFTGTDWMGKLRIHTDTIFSAIGFMEHHGSAIRRADLITNQTDLASGYLSEGLYCVGWFKRGPQGTIPANRTDAKLVSDRIVEDLNIHGKIREQHKQ
jgi:ferredoxin--NADP+ reductase